jgi:excisionase family DNA binding protein
MPTYIYHCQKSLNVAIRPGDMQENLLTIAQIAEYLKVDKFTVYRLVTQKKIPAFKVGIQWRFKKEIIDKWLQENSNLRD